MKGYQPQIRLIAILLAFGLFSVNSTAVFAQAKAKPGTHATHSGNAPKPAGQTSISADPFWAHSYNDALAKAAPVGGMVFVRLVPVEVSAVKQKEPFSRAVFDSLKAYSVAGVTLPANDTNWARLQSKIPGGQERYQAKAGSFAFVNGKGIVLCMYAAQAQDSAHGPADNMYLSGLRQALDRKTGMQQLTLFEAERMLGDKDEDKLEAIIRERTREGLPTDSLLDVYVAELPADSATSPRVLRFLAMQAPLLNSMANQLLREDATRFMDVWQSLSIRDRVRINNEVIEKTCHKAIRDTNENVATLAATFAANTNQSNVAKVRAYQGIMLEYYFGIGDTLRYLNLAGAYFDRFLMHMDPDSLRKEDSIHHRQEDMSVAKFVGEQLEKGALRVAAMTSNRNLLQQAAEWADMAAAMYPSPEAIDTRDRLISRLRPQKP